MVVFEVHIVQVLILVSGRFQLIEVGRDIAYFIQILRPYLTNMKINQVAVVSVDFVKFLLCQVLNVEEPLNVNIFMRKNH